MKNLKGYENVVSQMTPKLAHACGMIKAKLTQESPKPIKDFEVSCEGATKATITFYDGRFLFEETTDIEYLYKAIEETVSSDPENLKYSLRKDYSCGGPVKIELQDHSQYCGISPRGFWELKPKDENNKSAYIFNLIEENIEFHNKITAMKCILERHNLMDEVNELLRWVEKK